MFATLFSHSQTPQFLNKPIPSEILRRLLKETKQAPSDFNLQPISFVVVDRADLKERLANICLNYKPIANAPSLIVFAADRRLALHRAEEIMLIDQDQGLIHSTEASRQEAAFRFLFGWKESLFSKCVNALLCPLLRVFSITPILPFAHKRYWLAKQAMIYCTTFAQAAQKEHLSCIAIDILDEYRCRRILNIPSHYIIPVVLAVGYIEQETLRRFALGEEEGIHVNEWQDN